jgi:hypothetical protein
MRRGVAGISGNTTMAVALGGTFLVVRQSTPSRTIAYRRLEIALYLYK